MFIVLEGISDCGKTNHARLLAEFLMAQDYKIKLTSEPSQSRLGWGIRELLKDEQQWKTCEYLTCLFSANRHEHVYAPNGIKPALDEGKVVICDRYILSSYVYQYECLNLVKDMNLKFPVPDLLIYLEPSQKDEQQTILANRYRFFIGTNNPPARNKYCFGNIDSFSPEESQEKIREEVKKYLPG